MALNVLVVDDSAVMRAMIVKTLRMLNLPFGQVLEAGNGQEGLAVLDQNWVDVILVDINMPVMNGEEMIERLRQNPATKDVPVVVVSTEGSETRIERLVQKGATFVHKPFSPEAIRDVIKHITGVSHEQTV
jgi:two-component system chemotaxis response regulator CheY